MGRQGRTARGARPRGRLDAASRTMDGRHPREATGGGRRVAGAAAWRRAGLFVSPSMPTPAATPGIDPAATAAAAPDWRLRLRLAALVALALYAVARLRDPEWWDLLDDVDLAIHEAGHIVFAPFGDVLAALGGSLFQLLVPLAFVVYFARSRQRWAAAVTLAWVAVNCLYVGRYAADARARDLPLLGGESTIHDWWFVLIEWDLLAWDAGIGRAFHAAAFVLFVLAVGGGVAFARDGVGRETSDEGRGTG